MEVMCDLKAEVFTVPLRSLSSLLARSCPCSAVLMLPRRPALCTPGRVLLAQCHQLLILGMALWGTINGSPVKPGSLLKVAQVAQELGI